MSKYLVTSALPYSNGELHIGHIAGAYLPADIFVRFLKLKQKNVHFVCGTDEHGAPISIKAEAEKVKPMDIVQRYHNSIFNDFKRLNINFDNFSGTARELHHKTSQQFFTNLLEAGYITTAEKDQFYCEFDKRFLADRYIEGICPHCKGEDARGDQCDNCGKLMDTLSLVEPKCKICGNRPVVKRTKHWFLDLPKFEKKLKNWIESKTYWKENIRKFILGLLNEGLLQRAITRDLDWGIPVPLEDAQGKVLYVWFDAPIGYLSSSKEYFKNIGKKEGWKDYWLNEDTKMIHFIGKDNNVFHALFWPAILMGQKENFILPYDIPANEFLNLEGEKLSTSKNWAIWVNEFLDNFDGDLLRYYIARIAPENKDSDFYWKDFQDKINSDLANNIGNLANRIFLFTKKNFGGNLQAPKDFNSTSKKLFSQVENIKQEIESNYFNYKVRINVSKIMEIGKLCNRYFDEQKPWVTVKTDRKKAEETLFVCCQMLNKIIILLTPIIPKSMGRLRKMLGLPRKYSWNDLFIIPQSFFIGKTAVLFPKIEDKIINVMVKKLKLNSSSEPENNVETEKISIEDFQKIEMRVVKIEKCEKVPKSKKLVRATVDIGKEKRVVFAGLSNHYNPVDLIGKKVIMLTNLKPRKMMGEESCGMILAAVDKDELSLLVPQKDIALGSIVS